MPTLKIIVLGPQKVGKTAFVSACAHRDAHVAGSQTEAFVTTTLQLGGDTLEVQIYDTPTDARFRTIDHNWYDDAKCCVFVFSVTEQASFDELERWYQELTSIIPKVNDRRAKRPEPPMPFPKCCVVGTKIDQPRKVDAAQVYNWCQNHGDIPYFEVTSLNSVVSVNNSFRDIVRYITGQQPTPAPLTKPKQDNGCSIQ